MIDPEFSRRMGRLTPSLRRFYGINVAGYYDFIDRITEVDSFDDLSQEDKDLISTLEKNPAPRI